jgi:hypothetical protein
MPQFLPIGLPGVWNFWGRTGKVAAADGRVAQPFKPYFSFRSETGGAPSLRFLPGRVRCCLWHKVSAKSKPALRAASCPPFAKNAKSEAPLVSVVPARSEAGPPAIVHARHKPMQIALRPAVTQDFKYCRRIYFAGMDKIIEELNLDRTAQADGFRRQWVLTEVQIITLDGSDVGWLQIKKQG